MKRTNGSLAKRRDLLKAHLRYLHSVAANPATLNAEIARHRKQIAEHEAAIARMTKLQTTVHDDIERVESELQEVALKLNTAKLEKKIKLYLELLGNVNPKTKTK